MASIGKPYTARLYRGLIRLKGLVLAWTGSERVAESALLTGSFQTLGPLRS